jgi:cytosine/adenosine deaminase-related metal-dependent hydrolase
MSSSPADPLEPLLERWAARSRLTETEAETIRASIVRSAEAGLDPAWWQDLVGRVNTIVVHAATLPEAAQEAMRQAVLMPAYRG